MLSVFDLFTRPPAWAEDMERRINARIASTRDAILDTLETFMAVTQADLDNLATQLTADAGAIQQEIKALQDANPNLDLSGLTQAVANVGSLVPSAVTGGTGPVADDPNAPVVDGSGASDS